MKSNKENIRKEYSSDLIKSGIRGKHVSNYQDGTNIVFIAPDLHELFPDSEAVDKALRDYLSKRHPSP